MKIWLFLNNQIDEQINRMRMFSIPYKFKKLFKKKKRISLKIEGIFRIMHKLVKLILLSHSFLNWKFNQFNQTRHQNYSIFFLSFWNQWYEDYIGTNCFWVNWYRVFYVRRLFQERLEIKLYVLRKLRARGSVLSLVPHTYMFLGSGACRLS